MKIVKVVVIGDMNARVGDSDVEGVIGKFKVSGANENGKKLRCIRKRDCMGEIHFLRKRIYIKLHG